jgi:hypothetical protein
MQAPSRAGYTRPLPFVTLAPAFRNTGPCLCNTGPCLLWPWAAGSYYILGCIWVVFGIWKQVKNILYFLVWLVVHKYDDRQVNYPFIKGFKSSILNNVSLWNIDIDYWHYQYCTRIKYSKSKQIRFSCFGGCVSPAIKWLPFNQWPLPVLTAIVVLLPNCTLTDWMVFQGLLTLN